MSQQWHININNISHMLCISREVTDVSLEGHNDPPPVCVSDVGEQL